MATDCPPLFVGADAVESPLSVPGCGEMATGGKNMEQQRVAIFADLDSPISVAGHPCSDAVTWTWQEGKRKLKGVEQGVGGRG